MSGSPPCVRGAGNLTFRRSLRFRFTPVRTGSRVGLRGKGGIYSVHPRAYGEQRDRQAL